MGRVSARLVRGLLPLCFGLVIALTGCEIKPVKVQLPTFFSAEIQELWFWRLDEQSQQYVRAGHLEFGSVEGPPGRKVLTYTIVPITGNAFGALTVPVTVRGDSITVELSYSRWEKPGWFRVSSRNAAGESGLSEEEIFL